MNNKTHTKKSLVVVVGEQKNKMMAIARISLFPRAIPLLITIFSLNFPVYAKYSGGTGEPDDPYQITWAEDLMLLGESPEDYNKHFILTADIDLSDLHFGRAVIAADTNDVDDYYQGTPFSGHFDGQGHRIHQLHVEGSSHLGLWGRLGDGAQITNLSLVDANVVGTANSIGLLVGSNRGNVYKCYSTGSVSGGKYVGGLVGLNSRLITLSYSTGVVMGSDYVGGLVGRNLGGSITASYSTGSVSGTTDVGGLVGWNHYGGSIMSSYSTGSVGGDNRVGSLVGENSWLGSITASYSTGVVTGNNDVGGLVGVGDNGSIISSSFWDIETSGQPTSAGGTGLTTPEMQEINTYLSAGWDFVDEILNGTCDYWQISPGDYPTLHYLGDNRPVMPEGLGTAEQPYLIREARDLGTVWFKPMAHYRLETSPDISGTMWSMAVVPVFGGTFEGNGHVISNLHIQGGGLLGLFGQILSEAKISNLGLEAVNVNGVGSSVGGLAGWNYGSVVFNCYSTGTVAGHDNVGGLVGNNGGSISNSHSNGSVSGDEHVGGLVGRNGGSITASYITGSVSGTEDVGGLVGLNDDGYITSSYSTGSVTGGGGGLVGLNDGGSITSCYSTGSVTGGGGGLVAGGRGWVSASFWDIQTSGQATSVGGTGATTAEMQTASTFLVAGWDFVGEIDNGPNDVWTIIEGQTYPLLTWQKYGGGIGDPNDPYLIYSAEHLNALGAEPNDYDNHFKLMADINLSGYWYDRAVIAPDTNDVENWYQGVPFTGVFDGNGHTISHLTITGDLDRYYYVGLFGQVASDAELKNLGVVDVNIIVGGRYIGGLVGDNSDSVTRCNSTGAISGGTHVGGLAGGNSGSITMSYSTVAVSGYFILGGLVGENSGSITASYSTGDVSGDENVGGLVCGNLGSISNSYSTGTVVAYDAYSGGLVAGNSGSITSSFWDIETSGITTSDGGEGKTTTEMQTASTFLETGWDFIDETENGTDDIWWILEGQDYPRLWWELIHEN